MACVTLPCIEGFDQYAIWPAPQNVSTSNLNFFNILSHLNHIKCQLIDIFKLSLSVKSFKPTVPLGLLRLIIGANLTLFLFLFLDDQLLWDSVY